MIIKIKSKSKTNAHNMLCLQADLNRKYLVFHNTMSYSNTYKILNTIDLQKTFF